MTVRARKFMKKITNNNSREKKNDLMITNSDSIE